MRIGVHLRDSNNLTNKRTEVLRDVLEDLGYSTITQHRDTPVKGSDLVIQTGFAATPALLDAIERRIPYIIMEAPYFRGFYDLNGASSWGYNGLAGGSYRPPPPDEPRAKPDLHPMKTEGGILIVGQKPTDHSLRGTDHVQWLLDRFSEYPTADFRPHPLMVPPGSLCLAEDALANYQKVILDTSTMGVEAICAGCEVKAYGKGNLCAGAEYDRGHWLHDLSWGQASHGEFFQLGSYILSGLECARERARSGNVERPRERVDGPAICARYYRAIVRPAATTAT